MNFVKQLTSEDQLLLVSLPYRVGVWISHIDDNTKTKLDDKREAQALEYAIKRYAGSANQMPFVAYIMQQVAKNRSLWKLWSQNTEEDLLFSDVLKVMELCKRSGNRGATKQYRRLIWQISMIVAQAHGENVDPDNEMHVDRFFAWIGSFFGPPKMQKMPENISAKEKSALQKLRVALKE